jgi:hypothetical protein
VLLDPPSLSRRISSSAAGTFYPCAGGSGLGVNRLLIDAGLIMGPVAGSRRADPPQPRMYGRSNEPSGQL